ncbi:MAG: cell division protein FtsZ [Anaerolineaceae bacterium]|nr:cell division protein FtsZ [Anaerolineaceae bacterium]
MNTLPTTHKKFTPIESKNPKIVVLGLGGGGSNAVNRMIENGLTGVTFAAANTDAQTLMTNLAPIKIQLGPKTTRGLGAGGLPTVGEASAEESYRELASILEGSDMVFLAAGMGGGTGTGSIPVVAKVAKAVGAVTVAVVTTPFSFELGRRQKNAEDGLRKLRQYTDTLIVIPNDRLLEIAPNDLPLEMAFTLADDVLRQGVQGIAELITETGIINVDFAHIKRIMQFGGGSLMAIGSSEGPDKVTDALQKALHHPLLDETNLSSATGIIANFRGGSNLTFREVAEALQLLQDQSDNHAEIIPGVINDPNMGDRLEIILIVTGIGGIKLEDALENLNSSEHWETDNNQLKSYQEVEQGLFTPNPYKAETNPNQYHPQLNFSSNLDIPAFMRKRLVQGR